MSSVVKKYSDALFSSLDSDLMPRITQILKRLSEVLESSRGHEIFSSPFINSNEKEELLLSLLDGLIGDLEQNNAKRAKNFALLLLQNGRLFNLCQIVSHMEKKSSIDRGIFDAYISTSSAPSSEELESIKTKLESELGTKLTIHIKESNKRGIKIDIPGLELQGSFKREVFLNTLKQTILKAI